MPDTKIKLAKDKETYLTTLWGKALDYRNADPILNDRWADTVVRSIDLDFATLKLPDGGEVTLPARAKQLDGWAHDFLAAHPAATVLHLGCGLDSRAFRIDPAPTVRWYDVDYPDVIDLRRQLYPERPGYHLVGAAIETLAFLNDIPTDTPVLVIGEGFFMYLSEAEGLTLFRAVAARFPDGEFILDAYNGAMVRLVSRLATVRGAQATLRWGINDPHALEQAVPGLKLTGEENFFCLPELQRLNWVQRSMCRIPGLRGLVKHLRYAF